MAMKDITKLMRRGFTILGLLAVVLLVSKTPLQAQTPTDPLTMEVALAWEGHIRQNQWTEVRITLKNEGADWQGELIVRDTPNQITYRRPVELPAHSYKQYRLPIFIKDGATPTLSLEDAQGVRQEMRLPFRGYDEENRVVVNADMRGPIIGAGAQMMDTHVWLSDLTALPETPMAWDGMDVLLLNGIATADLNAAQQEALLAWVAAGGHLIIGGGPALQQTLENLAEPLHVATPGKASIVPYLPLSGMTLNKESVVTLNDVAAVILQPGAKATPLVSVEDTILAVRGGVGKGYVDVIGWDLTHAGSEVWLVDLWINDPIPAISTPLTGRAFSTGAPNLSNLLEMPYASFSKIWGLLLLFPIYVFLMGPGTLILVRRLKRPVLAWIFIPAWIVGALIILALGLSGVFSRTFPMIHEIAMINVPDAALPSRVVQGTAIYAPRAGYVNWNVSGAPRPFMGSYRLDSWYDEGAPYPIEVLLRPGDAHIQARNPLGILTWATEGLYDSPAIRSELYIAPQDGIYHVVGELWSEAGLRDVTLLLGNATYSITLTQTLPPQQTISISRPATATYSSYGYANICGSVNYVYAPYYVVPTLTPGTPAYGVPIPPGDCYLTGFIDAVPFPANNIAGFHLQESCLIYTIACPAQPQGKIEATLENVSNKTENGWVDIYTHIVYGNAPSTVLDYILPVYLHITHVEKLTIALSADPGAGTLTPPTDIAEIAVWSWEKKEWLTYAPSEKIILTGAEATQAFDPQQGVRLRFTPKGNSFQVQVLITVEGTP